ncbi:phage tail protein I [Sphingobium sp.]|uniref:phage tail protein I n=1 Tax=Sphingobium sp. TaxID=1912891 RepID=UPI000DB095EF|nr:phage tail protein I [Sphingobium sp.]PZU67514.1 MAG: phage tail protein I [Sphingobium sp.]
MTFTSILPPRSTVLQKALGRVADDLLDLPVELRKLWSPAECPASHLPWLAWALSVDIWDANWSEAVKRAAVADAIAFQRRKGTRASLRTALDRFDPLIKIVEWHEDRATLDPHNFRLELPLLADSDVVYDEELVSQILRDIAQVKPVRSHMTAVYRMQADVQAWLVSAAGIAGQGRLDERADTDAAQDPIWETYLQTEQGEPILAETRAFLEH